MVLKAVRKATSGYYARPRRRYRFIDNFMSDRTGSSNPLIIQSESLMRTYNPLVLLVLLVTQSVSAQAADLNGAWTVDTASCGQV